MSPKMYLGILFFFHHGTSNLLFYKTGSIKPLTPPSMGAIVSVFPSVLRLLVVIVREQDDAAMQISMTLCGACAQQTPWHVSQIWKAFSLLTICPPRIRVLYHFLFWQEKLSWNEFVMQTEASTAGNHLNRCCRNEVGQIRFIFSSILPRRRRIRQPIIILPAGDQQHYKHYHYEALQF